MDNEKNTSLNDCELRITVIHHLGADIFFTMESKWRSCHCGGSTDRFAKPIRFRPSSQDKAQERKTEDFSLGSAPIS